MKILHVCKKYPRALGGDAVVVSNLKKQQLANSHEVAVVTSNCEEIDTGEHIYKLGLKDTPSGLDTITPRRILSLLVLSFRMFTILQKEKPDVIHTHSVDMAFFASFAARLYNVPIVHTFHIVTFYDKTQPLMRRKTEMWLAKRAKPHTVTAPNNYDVEKLRAAGLRQAVVLPNGVDMAFWRTANRPKRDKTFIFVAVGRLERQKGYEYLIKAAAILASTLNTTFRIMIIGEGSRKAALQNLAHTLRVDQLVTLVGRKNPKEIRTLLSKADAAVCPSLYETTPITLLEAWAAVIPVISTSVGILRDVPADFDAAYVVPPKNVRALMHAMGQCMTDGVTSSAIAAKGHIEAKKYAWPIITRTTEAIYRSTQ